MTNGLAVHRLPGQPPPVVALHGFSQTGQYFGELAGVLGRACLAPDLPGHGGSVEHPAAFGAAVAGLETLLETALEELGRPVPLLGYSQGGRIALALALDRPDLVSELALISASAGISDTNARAERRAHDEQQAEFLEREGLAAFLDAWLAMPMFSGMARRSDAWRAADRQLREQQNTAAGLARALRGMGQGAQPYLGERLHELHMPVHVVAGERDPRYVDIGARMVEHMPNARLTVVPDCGHALMAEHPHALASALGPSFAALS